MSIVRRDRSVIWHPYTQEKGSPEPVAIAGGKGAWLFGEDGKKYLDAIASWWVNLHGHSHPYIAKKVSAQLKKLEHVLFAGFTHEPAVTLAERLLRHLPGGQKKIFYSDNGSTAVEVAVKMAVQYWSNRQEKRNRILAFRNSYHGDTFGAMAVSSRSIFTEPFDPMLFRVTHIDVPSPGKESHSFRQLEKELRKGNVAAFIFEPLIQGAGGMVMYGADPLSNMIRLCRKYDVLTIADEVMTGFGRTGTFFAMDQVKEKPDMVCLSKGLTGGAMAMGITSCTQKIYNAFVSGNPAHTFYHGHSYTANPVACSAALASLDLMDKKATWRNIKRIESSHRRFVDSFPLKEKLRDIRTSGTILALELPTREKTGYLDPVKKSAFDFFMRQGILIRPLGNVLYLMPPYCITEKELNYIYKNLTAFLRTI